MENLGARTPVLKSGCFKVNNSDFKVFEKLSFEPSGEGEHLFLLIEKQGANTHFVAKELAQFFNLSEREIGFAGLKDRHAITQQWFSVQIPGAKAVPELPEHPEFKVLESCWNSRKLKTGAIALNRFEIILRNIEGDKEAIEKRLFEIKTQGVPNFFGEQRFGRAGQNLQKAIAALNGKRVKKHQLSIYISSLRSWFFNQFLQMRIDQGTWLTPLLQDRISLAGTRSFFVYDEKDNESITERLGQGDLHIAGPLPGADFFELMPELSPELHQVWQEHLDVIRKISSATDWRALRIIPYELNWNWLDSDSIQLQFQLSSGSYATELLAELGPLTDKSLERQEPLRNKENNSEHSAQ